MNYKGAKKPVKAKQPKNVANAESKIKDHVKYYKNMQKKSNYQDVFSKEPQIFAKPHPADNIYDPAVDSSSFQAKSVPLRRKSLTPSQIGSNRDGSVSQTLNSDQKMPDQAAQSPSQPDVVQESRTTGFYKGNSPSGVTSGLSERDMQPVDPQATRAKKHHRPATNESYVMTSDAMENSQF